MDLALKWSYGGKTGGNGCEGGAEGKRKKEEKGRRRRRGGEWVKKDLTGMWQYLRAKFRKIEQNNRGTVKEFN